MQASWLSWWKIQNLSFNRCFCPWYRHQRSWSCAFLIFIVSVNKSKSYFRWLMSTYQMKQLLTSIVYVLITSKTYHNVNICSQLGVGRTGRITVGHATSFYDEATDRPLVDDLINVSLGKKIAICHILYRCKYSVQFSRTSFGPNCLLSDKCTQFYHHFHLLRQFRSCKQWIRKFHHFSLANPIS